MERKTKEIDSIGFGVYSSEEIKNLSVCRIGESKENVGTKEECNDVYDPKMGFSQTRTKEKHCLTCNMSYKDCPGHIGHIEFRYPVFNPIFYNDIIRYLKMFCVHCYAPVINLDKIRATGIKINTVAEQKKYMQLVSKLQRCCNCSKELPDKIEFDKNNEELVVKMTYKDDVKNHWDAEQCYTELTKIKKEHLTLLGINPIMFRPQNMIFKNFPVMPPSARPSVTGVGDQQSDDELSKCLCQIMKANNKLYDNKLPTNKIKENKEKINKYLNEFYFSDSSKMNSNSLCCTQGIVTRLKGKEGIPRKNIMGKRVDFSARTVITPDPNLPNGVMGIPRKIANILTFPEKVTYYNKKFLTEFINNGMVASYETVSNGKFVTLSIQEAMYINVAQCFTNMSNKTQGSKLTMHLFTLEKKTAIDGLKSKLKNYYETKNETKTKGNDNPFYVTKNGKELTNVLLEVSTRNGPVVLSKRPRKDIKEIIESINSNKEVLRYIWKARINAKSCQKFHWDHNTSSESNQTYKLEKTDLIYFQMGDNEYKSIHLKKKNINLKYGDIVHRYLIDGDIVLLNRQPTLHKGSMLAKKIKIVESKTFSMNLATTKTFNADFDGDEMNIHVPQSQEALAELLLLSSTRENIISDQGSSPNIAIVQDSLVGAFLMTRNNQTLSHSEFYNIASAIRSSDSTTKYLTDNYINRKIRQYKSIIQEKNNKTFGTNYFDSRMLLSLLFPVNFIYTKSQHQTSNTKLRIYKGVIYEGWLDKASLGSSHASIIQVLDKYYGSSVAQTFVTNIQFVTNRFLYLVRPFSIGLEDAISKNPLTLQNIEKDSNKSMEKARKYKEIIRDSLVKERKQMNALNEARDKSAIHVKKNMTKDNNLKIAVDSGSKGDYFNITQTVGSLGQQNLKQGRVRPMLDGKRTLPHYMHNLDDMSLKKQYESRGFIHSSLSKGLNPQEFFFYAMSGREGICDTAMGTSTSGYIQRKLVKLMEDLQVQYDGTIRDSSGDIIQFSYGDNSIACNQMTKIKSNGKEEMQMMNIAQMVDLINLEHEIEQQS